MTTILVCHCACPDAGTAQRIATDAVESGLAACAQVAAPMQSSYRWQGRTETASEVLLVLKTRSAHWPALQRRVRALHPYEVPELVAFEAQASAEYAGWVEASTPAPPEAP